MKKLLVVAGMLLLCTAIPSFAQWPNPCDPCASAKQKSRSTQHATKRTARKTTPAPAQIPAPAVTPSAATSIDLSVLVQLQGETQKSLADAQRISAEAQRTSAE